MTDRRQLPGPTQMEANRIRKRIGRHVLFGAIALVAIVAGLGGMEATVELSAAVVSEGRLVEVLAPFAPEPLPIHTVYPSARLLPGKVRAFLDLIAETTDWRLAQ